WALALRATGRRRCARPDLRVRGGGLGSRSHRLACRGRGGSATAGEVARARPDLRQCLLVGLAFRVEELLCESEPHPVRDRPQDVAENAAQLRAPIRLRPQLRTIVEVARELAFEDGPDLVAVRTQLPEVLLDLLGEHRLGQVGLGPEHGTASAPNDTLRPA